MTDAERDTRVTAEVSCLFCDAPRGTPCWDLLTPWPHAPLGHPHRTRRKLWEAGQILRASEEPNDLACKPSGTG